MGWSWRCSCFSGCGCSGFCVFFPNGVSPFHFAFLYFILLSSAFGCDFFVCSVCSRSCASSGVAGFGLYLTCCLSFKFVWFLPSSCWGWLVWLCLWLVAFSLSLLVVLCSPVSVLRPVSSVVSSQMKSFYQLSKACKRTFLFPPLQFIETWVVLIDDWLVPENRHPKQNKAKQDWYSEHSERDDNCITSTMFPRFFLID